MAAESGGADIELRPVPVGVDVHAIVTTAGFAAGPESRYENARSRGSGRREARALGVSGHAAILAAVEQQRLAFRVVAQAQDLADEDHVVAAVVGVADLALEAGQRVGQDRAAAVPDLVLDARPFVLQRAREAVGDLLLVGAQDVNREGLGREEGAQAVGETELTEFTVIPINSPRGPTAVITVTPVAKQPSAALKSPGSTDGIPMAVADIILPPRTGFGSEAPRSSQRCARRIGGAVGDDCSLEPARGLP